MPACHGAPHWPRAWGWLRELAREWGCYFVLGSGSLNRLWRLPEFDPERPSLPALVPPAVRAATAGAEARRVTYRSREGPLDLAQLAGTSREAASRFLATLQRAGVLTTKRGRIVVHDPSALHRYIY